MTTLGSSATAWTLSRPTRPAEVWPDMPGTGAEQSTRKRDNRSADTPRPGYPRPAGGQRADHEPRYVPLLPRANRGWPRRSRGKWGTPVSTANSACFGMVTARLPCRASCLAAPQAGQQAKSRGEACALANSGCLIACLTARTAACGATGGLARALHGRRTQGSTPLPC